MFFSFFGSLVPRIHSQVGRHRRSTFGFRVEIRIALGRLSNVRRLVWPFRDMVFTLGKGRGQVTNHGNISHRRTRQEQAISRGMIVYVFYRGTHVNRTFFTHRLQDGLGFNAKRTSHYQGGIRVLAFHVRRSIFGHGIVSRGIVSVLLSIELFSSSSTYNVSLDVRISRGGPLPRVYRAYNRVSTNHHFTSTTFLVYGYGSDARFWSPLLFFI